MPTKKLPTLDAFISFEQRLKGIGYREISRESFKKNLERLGLEPPRKKSGAEAGYIFSDNNLSAIVWTTFVKSTMSARDVDQGWVLITEGDKPLYFASPMRRYEGFLEKLFTYSRIAKRRVEARPLCPICKRWMIITRGRGLKSRYWSCTNPEVHKSRQRVSFDSGLLLEDLDFLDIERDKRAEYVARRKAEGKQVHAAMLSRKPWKMKYPENQLKISFDI